MKLEVGKYYKTRDGRKVGPIKLIDCNREYPFTVEGGGLTYRTNGSWHTEIGRAENNDLIAEWTDTPDLTTIDRPFGLLDKATQDALRAHGGPYEILRGVNHLQWIDVAGDDLWTGCLTYRVKPQPTVETVTEDALIASNGMIVAHPVGGFPTSPVRVTFTRTNGVIDLDSYKVEAR